MALLLLVGTCIGGCSNTTSSIQVEYNKPQPPRACMAMSREYETAHHWCYFQGQGLSETSRRASCHQVEWYEQHCPPGFTPRHEVPERVN